MRQSLPPAIYVLPEYVRFEHAVNKANLRDVAGAGLARQVLYIIARRRPTQARAAELLGIDQPKVSALTRGKLSGFSMERLFHFLNALGRDVQITIKPKPQSWQQAHLKVTAACFFWWRFWGFLRNIFYVLA